MTKESVVDFVRTEKDVTELQNFAKVELQDIEALREAMLEARDMKPWHKLEEGENVVEFVNSVPRQHPLFANRMIFRVIVDGEEKDLGITKNSSLYRDILGEIAKGSTKLRIIRTGLGRADTRYTVRAA